MITNIASDSHLRMFAEICKELSHMTNPKKARGWVLALSLAVTAFSIGEL